MIQVKNKTAFHYSISKMILKGWAADTMTYAKAEKAIIHGRLIVPDESKQGDFAEKEGTVLFYNEKIGAIVPASEAAEGLRECAEVLDAAGKYVAPGFLNVHIHGCGGSDAMDGAPASLAVMQEMQARSGVTGFLPTTMTCAREDIARALDAVREAMHGSNARGARVLGAHLEGPFINPIYKGAQAEKHIIPADFSLLAPYRDVVKIATFAPEMLRGGWSFARKCRDAGIVLSIGHSAADYDVAREAIVRHGISHITHAFNAMAPLHHRKPGILGAAMESGVNCELITDNVHVHPAMQRLLWQAKGGQHVILITDSLRPTGLGDGPSELGGQEIFVKGTRATLADGTLAGSVLLMDAAIRNFRQNTGAALPDVIACVTKTPAEDLGIYKECGSLEPGKRADIAILDDDLQIAATIVGGRTVYMNGNKIAPLTRVPC